MHFYDLAKHQLTESGEKRVTYEAIAHHMAPEIQRLIQMKFTDPMDGKDQCIERFRKLNDDMEDKFRTFQD